MQPTLPSMAEDEEEVNMPGPPPLALLMGISVSKKDLHSVEELSMKRQSSISTLSVGMARYASSRQSTIGRRSGASARRPSMPSMSRSVSRKIRTPKMRLEKRKSMISAIKQQRATRGTQQKGSSTVPRLSSLTRRMSVTAGAFFSGFGAGRSSRKLDADYDSEWLVKFDEAIIALCTSITGPVLSVKVHDIVNEMTFYEWWELYKQDNWEEEGAGKSGLSGALSMDSFVTDYLESERRRTQRKKEKKEKRSWDISNSLNSMGGFVSGAFARFKAATGNGEDKDGGNGIKTGSANSKSGTEMMSFREKSRRRTNELKVDGVGSHSDGTPSLEEEEKEKSSAPGPPSGRPEFSPDDMKAVSAGSTTDKKVRFRDLPSPTHSDGRGKIVMKLSTHGTTSNEEEYISASEQDSIRYARDSTPSISSKSQPKGSAKSQQMGLGVEQTLANSSSSTQKGGGKGFKILLSGTPSVGDVLLAENVEKKKEKENEKKSDEFPERSGSLDSLSAGDQSRKRRGSSRSPRQVVQDMKANFVRRLSSIVSDEEGENGVGVESRSSEMENAANPPPLSSLRRPPSDDGYASERSTRL